MMVDKVNWHRLNPKIGLHILEIEGVRDHGGRKNNYSGFMVTVAMRIVFVGSSVTTTHCKILHF